MTETLGTLKVLATTQGFGTVQPAPFLDERHLWRQMETLQHLNGFTGTTEADVLGAAVRRASHKPETLQVFVLMKYGQSGDQKPLPRADEGLQTGCQATPTCI